MFSWIWLLLRRQQGKSWLTASGFLCAACAFLVLSSTTNATTLRVNNLVAQNWRPVYDLIVLPPQVSVPPGQAISPALLQGYSGGITVQQYQQVRSLPHVEIAAPIAFLGYAQLPAPLWELRPVMDRMGYYKVEMEVRTSNGVREVAYHKESRFFYFASASKCSKFSEKDFPSFEELRRNGIEVGGCGSSHIVFPSLETGTFLVAAIDPEQEGQLVGLEQSLLSGRMLTNQETLRQNPQRPTIPMMGAQNKPVSIPVMNIPVMVQQKLPGSVAQTATVTYMAPENLDPREVIEKGGTAYLQKLPNQQQIFQGKIPLLQNEPKRLTSANLLWDGSTWKTQMTAANQADARFLYLPSGVTYAPATSPNGKKAYTLQPLPQQNGIEIQQQLSQALHSDAPSALPEEEVYFRSLRPLLIGKSNMPPYVKAMYNFDIQGQFSGQRLKARFDQPINWLPENTYVPTPTLLKYDAQGKPVPPKEILPTPNPAGYLFQPPLALTTLHVARQLIGDTLISAIRVRVSGVDTPNEASWQRIQQLAQSIEQRTGLHALVTLGSSPQPTLVYVPGVKKGEYGAVRDVAPLGWVEERWIYPGAGLVYVQQARDTQMLFLGAILLVCTGFLLVSLSAQATARQREFALLGALGWHPYHVAQHFLMQILFLACGGGVLGLLLALLVVTGIGVTIPFAAGILVLPGVFLLACLTALYPFWQVWKIHPAEILHAGISLSSAQVQHVSRLDRILSPLLGLALRNLQRTRGRILIAGCCLFLSTLLLMVMGNGVLHFQQQLQGTLLGNEILLQTVLPQLCGVLFALLLTFAMVTDLFLLQFQERRHEVGLLQALGWDRSLLYRLFLQEGVLLAGGSILAGLLCSLAFLASSHRLQWASVWIVIGTLLTLVGGVILAIVPTIRAIRHMQLIDILRAE
ncbi:FtsX-like permease family protein [Thermosporothrix hazakensis]|uniref:FtsX-like permease family protein n=1 Tax=Thermosporothrix hazakensis TaxID=644383 RepID=A0A326U5V9_THEHA|nr:ABC transporter permease [Thermosporothrix hazakensis]PZW28334.1 FtsX-like permease family protein [Thermosporothrix hazakensis]